jgi:hypothetical protein
VAGARAFRSSAPIRPTVAVHNVIVLASGAVVQISCQSTAARAALVAAACAGVQRSLHIA